MLTPLDLILRIAVAALMGATIGYEREIHGQEAGLRTHLLVAIASATFMVLSIYFFVFQPSLLGARTQVDPSRIASSVVTGIGFLAGGAILKGGGTIHGLTTAAGLWLVTAIGLCDGAGMYWVGGVATAMGLLVLAALRLIENKRISPSRPRLFLVTARDAKALHQLMKTLTALGLDVSEIDYDKITSKEEVSVSFTATIPGRLSVPELIERIEANHGMLRIQVRSASERETSAA